VPDATNFFRPRSSLITRFQFPLQVLQRGKSLTTLRAGSGICALPCAGRGASAVPAGIPQELLVSIPIRRDNGGVKGGTDPMANREKLQKLLELLQANIYLTIGILIASLLIVAWMRRFWHDWYREDAGRADTDEQILQEMQELHSRGEISDEEFRSIKSRLRGTSSG
jgi:hypothetical protein